MTIDAWPDDDEMAERCGCGHLLGQHHYGAAHAQCEQCSCLDFHPPSACATPSIPGRACFYRHPPTAADDSGFTASARLDADMNTAGTMNVDRADFDRMVHKRRWRPGDRVRWHRDDRDRPVDGVGVVAAVNGVKVTVVSDDAGAEVSLYVGMLYRWSDSDEIALAVRNATAAGYRWEPDQSVWADRENGHAYGGPCDEHDPPQGLVDTYGHAGPGCDHCGIPIERFTSRCFQCGFWLGWAAKSGRTVIADGHHFVDGGARSTSSTSSLGHGGRRCRITFFDGRTVETNNLWTHGKIPQRFRGLLPDNANLEWLAR